MDFPCLVIKRTTFEVGANRFGLVAFAAIAVVAAVTRLPARGVLFHHHLTRVTFAARARASACECRRAESEDQQHRERED